MNAAKWGDGDSADCGMGSFAAIYGILLASGAGTSASTVPLPINMGDTKLLLGGQALPLVRAGAVNAFDSAGAQSERCVFAGGAARDDAIGPLAVTVVALRPGIYTVNETGAGEGIVQIAGTSLLAAPAAVGTRPCRVGRNSCAALRYRAGHCGGDRRARVSRWKCCLAAHRLQDYGNPVTATAAG